MKRIMKFFDDIFVTIIESKFAFVFYLMFLLLLGLGFLYIKFLLIA
jgi:hypothetical protein